MTPATARILPSRADAINVPRVGHAGRNPHTVPERGELAALPDGSDLVNSWSGGLKARRVGVGDFSHAPLHRREAVHALVRRAREPELIDREIGRTGTGHRWRRGTLRLFQQRGIDHGADGLSIIVHPPLHVRV